MAPTDRHRADLDAPDSARASASTYNGVAGDEDPFLAGAATADSTGPRRGTLPRDAGAS
jgi:hypothetical protein